MGWIVAINGERHERAAFNKVEVVRTDTQSRVVERSNPVQATSRKSVQGDRSQDGGGVGACHEVKPVGDVQVLVVAASVVFCGFVVVIHSIRIIAPQRFIVVTNAIAIHVGSASPVANAQGIGFPHTVVDIVTDAVSICVCCAGSTAHANSVHLVAIAVAFTLWDVLTSALVNLSRAIPRRTRQVSDAVVDVVANAV